MFCFFILLKFSKQWGPVFHQYVSNEFALEYFPHLNSSLHQNFVLGNVLIDSLPKQKFHNLTFLIELLSQEKSNSEKYWFYLGMLTHLSVDLFGHLGKPYSFLPLHPRILHYLSELSTCSVILHCHQVSPLKITKVSRKILQQRFSRETPHRFFLQIFGSPEYNG